MKNVLFLAPSHNYADTVVKNQSDELTRAGISHKVNKSNNARHIHTDKVHVEIVYADPVKWNSSLFRGRDAIFGKRELVDNAWDSYGEVYATKWNPCSLSKYIRDLHASNAPKEEKPRTSYLPEITNVYFNDPVTVVLWDDGTKTIVKCQDGDVYSEEVGLSLCITKKALGNMPNFNNVFRKWVPSKVDDDVFYGQVQDYIASQPGFLGCVDKFFEKLKKGGDYTHA